MTKEQDMLHARNGRRQIKFRYELVRAGVPKGTIPVLSASISHDSTAAIKRSARFELANDNRIDWLNDRIKVYLLVRNEDLLSVSQIPVSSWGVVKNNLKTWGRVKKERWGTLRAGTVQAEAHSEVWNEYPLGLFIPSTPTRGFTATGVSYEVEAYDLTLILKEDCVIDRYYIAAGTPYLDAIAALLASAGILNVFIDPAAQMIALPTDREFDVGTSKLEIANTLLKEINYNTVSVDSSGVFRLSAYHEPSNINIKHEYRADKYSVIGSEASTIMDLFSVPNIFIAVVSNPELDEPMRSVYINDNPSSILSTVRRGRNIVSQIYKPDVIENQELLDDYIRRIAFEESQVYQETQFETVIMPNHEDLDVLWIEHPDFSGVFEEVGWSMQLAAGEKMRHTVRRVMQI